MPLVLLRQACSWLSGRPSCGKTPSLFLRKRRKLNFKKKERIQNNPQFLTHVSLTVSSTTHTSALTTHPPNSTWPKMLAAATNPGNALALWPVCARAFSLSIESPGPLRRALGCLSPAPSPAEQGDVESVLPPTPTAMLFNTVLLLIGLCDLRDGYLFRRLFRVLDELIIITRGPKRDRAMDGHCQVSEKVSV